MGIFKRLFGIKDELPMNEISAAGESLDQERLNQMFERPLSFSLVAIPGDLDAEIPAFLAACGNKTLSIRGYTGPFTDLYAGVEQRSGPDNSIGLKAWFTTAGHTIPLDPETVLLTETTHLSELAAKVEGTVKAAIWERVSESVALVEVGPQGIVRQSWYCQGEQSNEPIDEHSEIAAQPDSEGLKMALAKFGLSEDAMFGHVDATVVELQG